MLDEVRRLIAREALLKPGAPVRVAVSGGVDSMVLLHVLRALGHPCTVAHADHGLRGAESDGDREFVGRHCRDLGIRCEVARLDVKAHAQAQGLSVQMAARDLRRAWLTSLSEADELPVALAHHADDAVETLFINLLRGTGERGWSGIAPKSQCFVRPLLAVHRTPILEYAVEKSIAFREDSSNADPKYLRNRIRSELVPLLERLRPGARRTLARSVDLLRGLEQIADGADLIALAGAREEADGSSHVPFSGIEQSSAPQLLLHRLLRQRGFHPDMIERVRDAIAERATGSLFTSAEWQACVDRDTLIINQLPEASRSYAIEHDAIDGAAGPFAWSWATEAGTVPDSMDEVLLDGEKLSFPLLLRPWAPGDRMRPIGLGGSKLVSDILIDTKVPLSAKRDTYVLVSGGVIAWLVGHRLSEGFQATAHSRKTLRCAFLGN